MEVLEAAVSGPMAGDVGRFRTSDRFAVGLQSSPLSSSRTYSASTGGSLTGSFDHGVSWFSRLLPAHVYPAPDSDTWNPNEELAITFSQGAGVDWPGPATMTYSRPSLSNPPSPLKNSSCGSGG